MADFGFDTGLLTANFRRQPDQQTPQQQIGQQIQNQQAQATLGQLLYNQQRQRSFADLISQNSGMYSDPYAQNLARGGYGQEAADAQAQAFQRQQQAQQLLDIHSNLTASQLSAANTPAQLDKVLSSLDPTVRSLYGAPDLDAAPEEKKSWAQGFISSRISPEKRAQQELDRLKIEQDNMGVLTRKDPLGNSYPEALYNKKTAEVIPLSAALSGGGAGGGSVPSGKQGGGAYGLSPEVMDDAAKYYNQTGGEFPKGLKLPRGAMGMLASGAIIARAAELKKQAGDTRSLAEIKATYGAASHELGQSTIQQGQQAVLEDKAIKDIQLLREQMRGIPDYNLTWANKSLRSVMEQTQSPQMGKYATQLYTTAQGLSKALASSTTATEGQRQEASEILSKSDSLENTAGKLEVLMRDIQNSGLATKQRVQNAKDSISGTKKTESAAGAPDHDAALDWLKKAENKKDPNYAAVLKAYKQAHPNVGSFDL